MPTVLTNFLIVSITKWRQIPLDGLYSVCFTCVEYSKQEVVLTELHGIKLKYENCGVKNAPTDYEYVAA